MKRPGLPRLTPLAGAALVLALNVGLTLFAARIVAGHVAQEAEARFSARTNMLEAQFARRLDDFRNLVLGMQGLFVAAPQTSRADFHRYSETLGLQQRLPGLQALSFQRRVMLAERDRFVAAVRADRSLDPRGYPGFAIRPEGVRAEYLVIDYLEPMAANLPAFGYDAATQPANREAIRQAMESGSFQASAPFNVVQSPHGPPRIVLRAPVYRHGMAADTAEQRRDALAGFVVLTLETEKAFGEAFDSLLLPGERLRIEDAGTGAPGEAARIPVAAAGAGSGTPALTREASVAFGGRVLALRHSADAEWLEIQPGREFPASVRAAGLTISLLLAFLYFAMAGARQRAIRLADERTRVLRATQDNMAQGISVIGGDLRLIGHNRRFLELLGFPESLAAEGATFRDFVRYNAERGEYGEGEVDELVRARVELARRFEPHRLKRKRPDGTVLEIIGTPLPGGGMVTTYSDITQQERAEEALRRSEQRHRTLVEMSPDAIFVHREGIIQLANPAAARLLGAAGPGQLVGLRIESLVAADDLPRVRERIAALVEGRAAFVPPNEVTYIRLDGSRVEVESLGALIDLDGTAAVLTEARDISDRKRAESALRENEARFSRIIEQSPISMAIVGLDGTIEFVNRKAIETFGYPLTEIPDMQTWWQKAYPDPAYRSAVTAQWMGLVEKAIAENHEIEPREYRVTCQDGSVKTVEIFGVPVGGQVFVMFDDITERKRAEAALQRQTAVLQTTLDHLDQGISVADADLHMTAMNRRYGELLGFPDELTRRGAPLSDFFRYNAERGEYGPGDVNEQVRERIERARRFEPHRFKRTRPDGTILEIRGTPLPGGGFVTSYTDITEQEHFAERMQRERDFRQHLIESIPGVFYLFDQDGHFLLWNHNFERVAGYSAAEMARIHPLDLFDGADRERVAQRIGATFTTGSATAEALFRAKDGGKRPFFFTGERVTLEDGRPGLVGVGFDLSERKRAEDSLARQRAILQATLESMDQGISVVDRDLHMTALNRRFCELLDFPAEMGVEGADFAAFVRYNAERGEYGPCDVEAKVREMVERARHPTAHQFRRTRPNGRVIEVRGEPMPDGGFVTTYTDVTEQERAQAAVRRERDFRQQLIESIPGIFYLFDRAGRFLLWNRNLEALLGVGADELATLRTIDMYDEPDRPRIRAATRQALETGSSSTEAALVAKSGARIPYFISGLRIEVEGEQTVIGLGLDISERKHTEQVIRELNDSLEHRVRERTAELEASNQELESFSYSVSHDLRAPLRALHGFSHLLAEEYAHRLDENALGYLRRIQAASERMGNLIDDMLELARVSRRELKRVDVDLAALAREIAAALQEAAPGRGADWHIAPGMSAKADPVLLRALLDNLLGNAWKFTAECGTAVIEVGIERRNGEEVFFVRDNGAGFEMAYADKLFQPFQRLHDAKRFEGSGIGLAIVHRIVRRHGGRVWAESTPGQGATFFFTLP